MAFIEVTTAQRPKKEGDPEVLEKRFINCDLIERVIEDRDGSGRAVICFSGWALGHVVKELGAVGTRSRLTVKDSYEDVILRIAAVGRFELARSAP